MLIIQLLGLAGSGKDWTAEQLKTYFESQGKSVEIMAYAAPMKQIISKTFGISLDELDKFKRDENIVIEVTDYSGFAELHEDRIHTSTNFRGILQNFGQVMKSEFEDDVWVNLLNSKITKSSADVFIISDCRFHAEVKSVDATTIRVINNDIIPLPHSSETELLSYPTDFKLENTGKCADYGVVAALGHNILYNAAVAREITARDVYEDLYLQHKSTATDGGVPEDTASRIANIYAVQNTNRFFYSTEREYVIYRRMLDYKINGENSLMGLDDIKALRNKSILSKEDIEELTK